MGEETVDFTRVAKVGAASGPDDDFAGWYREYAPMIRNYVISRTRDPLLAEDCTSLTFLRAFAKRGSFHDRGDGARPWLFTIARNTVHDHNKVGFRRHEVPVEVIEDCADLAATPEQSVMSQELVGELGRCIDQLPPDQARCIRLRFMHEMSVAETARAMHRADNAVRTLQHRAIHGLRAVIAA